VKAVRIHEDGGPEVLRYEDVEDPAPGSGEVLVRLRAASLNHLDLWIRQGLPSVPKPRILGADGAGVVAALGEGADTFSEGDRVVLNPGLDDGARILGEHMDGTHAQLVAVPAEYVHPIPGGLSFEEAAAFPLVFETAYRMLVTKARIEEGEWVLLWGIGSGVALAAFAIAKALGARTLVTSSSTEKLARASELGADATVNHAEDDVASLTAAATTSSSSTSARLRGKRRFSQRHPTHGWSSAERRVARTRRRSSIASGGNSSLCTARPWGREKTSRVRTS
jgi:NADPH:quinone reductase-like Zn-dependent oxidoreductase